MKQQINLDHKVCFEILKLSDNAIYTYILIKSLYNPQMEIMYLSANSLIYQMDKQIINKTKRGNSRIYDELENGLKELSDNHYIKIIDNNKDDYVVDMSALRTEVCADDATFSDADKHFFTPFDMSALYRIYNETKKKKIFRFLFYFLSCRYDNHEMFYFNKERQQIADESMIDIRTVDNYLKLFETEKIIYTYRYQYKYYSNNQTVCNAYGLFADKSRIESECNKFIKQKLSNGEVYLSKTYANKGKNTQEYKEKLKESKEEKKQGFGTRKSQIVDFPVVEEVKQNNVNQDESKISDEQYKSWGLNAETIAEIRNKSAEPPEHEEMDIATIF